MAHQVFSIKQSIQFGWTSLKKHWKFIFISLVIVMLARGITGSVLSSLDNSLNLGGIVTIVSNWVLDSFVTMAALIVSLKIIDGKKPAYNDLYSHYPKFLRYLMGSVLVSLIMLVPVVIISIGNNMSMPLLTILGTVLILFPGIYLSIKYQFTTYLIVDQGMHPIDAFKKSGKITEGIKRKLFLFSLAQIGVVLLGAAALLVGLAVAIPVAYIASTYVYRKVSSR